MAPSWPERFRAAHGRAPRILHIGNVANFAYANAALQRRFGVDAEVIDPDSYHIMAHPAWAEAPIAGEWGDDFNPDWSRVSTGGWQAPDWFAQGPRDLVLAFAAARGRGDEGEARRIRLAIEGASWRRASLLRHARRFLRGGRMPAWLAPLRTAARAFAYRAPETAVGGPAPAQSAVADAPPEIASLARAPGLGEAMGGYDIVQGYALGAVYGLAAGHPAVAAVELGTLRGMPFEDSARGRLCAWTYRRSHAVLVTNSDCMAQAAALGIPPERRHPMLHPFDTDKAAQPEKGERKQTPYFLAPARHHWREGSASFLKGNNRWIAAAARLARENRDFRIVTIRWGEDWEASRALIAEHGLEGRTTWLAPLSRARLEPLMRGACAVIDQFAAASLGGLGLETLAMGGRLVTRYDEAAGALYFRTPPPLLGCAGVDDAADAMRRCLDDPDDAARLGARARAWMKGEHGVERQMTEQFAVFEAMLAQGEKRCAS
ncbi:MAG: hypothetical protein DI629_11780 [Mesorhizobium amorphae]|nr:MAG: hypothetical protein DI629_11780 [Mesorhizobium amorphae]